jgi:ADP-ribose pyrophosphatase
VRELRQVYHRIRQDKDWLVYKIALLRYGLHTLSFDSNRDAGECSPTQLWYALLSMESLLFELMGDDYHLKIRSERPADYPKRFRIQLDQASWKAKCPDYAPPYYVSDSVLDNSTQHIAQGGADLEDKWHHEDFIDWGRPYIRAEDNKPLNPSGRTGIAGRGGLWLWGANPMVFLTPIFYDAELNQLELLLSFHKDDPELICTHLRRDEPLEEAVRRAKSKIELPSSSYQTHEVHTGYLYDPRQTDNAWVEAKSYLLFVNKEAFQKTGTGETFWKELDHRLVNNLYSSQGYVLRKAVQYIHDQDLVTTAVIRKLLEKTG